MANQWEPGGELPFLDSLGNYERAALQYALTKRGLELDEDPRGKVVGKIHVVNLDVFGPNDGFLRIGNIFHITTREDVIRREVLLTPQKPWNTSLLQETQRRLKDPLWTTLSVAAPIKSENDGVVDVLVVTRDIWSLRLNSDYELFQGKLTKLQFSLAENNIFGRRKHGSVFFVMSQSNISVGPQYIDKAVGGSRLRLSGNGSAIFGRESLQFEGTSSNASLTYPLWALRTPWGGDVSLSHYDSIVRFFRGTEVEGYDDPDTDEVEAIPRTYSYRSLGLETSAVRSFGFRVIQRLTAGHSFAVRRPDFVDDYEGTPESREAFARDVFPRDERVSAFFVRYALFQPRYSIYRNLSTFDLAEDVRLGPELNLGASAALNAIGSQNQFYGLSGSLSWVFDIAEDGFLRFYGGATTRLQAGEAVDNLFSTSVKVAAPRVNNLFRVVAEANLGIRLRERGNDRFLLGGSNGVRGYLINEFIGQKSIVTNVEVRSTPYRWAFTRFGGTAFWDMGHAANRLGELRLKHGVGVGLRFLIPQLQPVVFRFDYAIPLNGPSAGFPGRFTAGASQTF